jgi:hypothetical protein
VDFHCDRTRHVPYVGHATALVFAWTDIDGGNDWGCGVGTAGFLVGYVGRRDSANVVGAVSDNFCNKM